MPRFLRPGVICGASVFLASAVFPVGQARAQAPGAASAYVPLDDNTYAYIDALVARGRLKQLSLLERPYRLSEIRRALSADSAGSPAVQSLYRRLAEAIAKYDVSDLAPGREALRYAVTPYVIATAQTSGITDLMHPDSTDRIRPGFGGIGIVQAGPVVAAARAYHDPRLKDDPFFLGKKNRAFVGRMEDAYASAQFRYAELFFGRLARNWGPSQYDGLLLGRAAYTYDHLYIKLGVPALHLSTVVTRLDDNFRDNGITIDTARRYFSVHQLTARLGRFEMAVSEAVVYGGRTENFRANYVNPLTPYILSQVLEKASGNTLFGADIAYRSRFGNFHAQGVLDDVAIDKCEPNCTGKPNSFGFTASASAIPLFRDQRLFASYTMVNNLMYRNEDWFSTYMSDSIGLARGYSDYDQVRVGLDLLVVPGIPLRPYVAYQRQGEGDYRIAHPLPAQYGQTRQFLQGVVQHTTRYAISGAGSIARYAQITGDIGYNHVTNASHVSGATSSRFVGRIGVTIESPWRLAGTFNPE